MKILILFTVLLLILSINLKAELTYPIVDTGQIINYDDFEEIPAPAGNEPFYGQDAQIDGLQPSYIDNGDGTITDNITGLMWQKSPDMDGDGDIDYDDKMSYEEALTEVEDFDLAGYDDWRLPSIKEIYSLIMFNGLDPSGWQGSDPDQLTPFINTDFFDFAYGDTAAGERIIDAQMASSTLYVGTTMNGADTMFGVNFADGRIKGYPTGPMPGQSEDKQFYVYYVRGNSNYGINIFTNNEDGTVSDAATGLMSQQNDSGIGLNWEEALDWVQQKNAENYLDYNDWRLPNIKELQCLVDYTRAPAVTGSAAIDPAFSSSEITNSIGEADYPYFWSSTTHANMENGGYAAYVAFGRASGWMEEPPNSGNYSFMDVHGAGAQRSDPKSGDPDDWPYGHGPQGDVVSIYNYVRLVRDVEATSQENETLPDKTGSILEQNYPNPFNPNTTLAFSQINSGDAELEIFNIKGQLIRQFTLNPDQTSLCWDGADESGEQVFSGLYFYQLKVDDKIVDCRKCLLLK
jgi:hypothetical protein